MQDDSVLIGRPTRSRRGAQRGASESRHRLDTAPATNSLHVSPLSLTFASVSISCQVSRRCDPTRKKAVRPSSLPTFIRKPSADTFFWIIDATWKVCSRMRRLRQFRLIAIYSNSQHKDRASDRMTWSYRNPWRKLCTSWCGHGGDASKVTSKVRFLLSALWGRLLPHRCTKCQCYRWFAQMFISLRVNHAKRIFSKTFLCTLVDSECKDCSEVFHPQKETELTL